jgi:hypothetical protein
VPEACYFPEAPHLLSIMSPQRFVHLLCAVAVLMAAAARSHAVTFNVAPTADALVSAANPANNYGGAGAITASAAGLPKGEQQSLLKFDFAAAKASFDTTFGAGNWELDGASLQLTAANPNNALFNTSAAGVVAASWMQNDSWTEGTGTPAAPAATGITWNSLASFLSAGDESLGSFAFGGGISGTSMYSLSPSAGLNADAVAGGLASIRLYAGDAAVAALFNSRSGGATSARPVLILSAIQVPEPTSTVLLLVGLFAASCLRRRIGT